MNMKILAQSIRVLLMPVRSTETRVKTHCVENYSFSENVKLMLFLYLIMYHAMKTFGGAVI
jgi:hypothetical protein